MCTKLYSLDKFANFRGVTLGSHSDAIRAVFFEKNSLDLITIARYCVTSEFIFLDYEISCFLLSLPYLFFLILTGMDIFAFGRAVLIPLTWRCGSH